MSTHTSKLASASGSGQGSPQSYTIGFILSIILTFVAYGLVVGKVFTGWYLVFSLIGLALIQLLVQLVFFLHLSHESKPRWNLIVFSFMMVTVLIIALGTLWIMDNLDYNHGRSPAETDKSIIRDELIKR